MTPDPDCRAQLAAATALAAARLRTMRAQDARIRQLAADVAALRAALDRACGAATTSTRVALTLADMGVEDIDADARRGRAT